MARVATCLTADLVESRKSTDRAGLQAALRAAIDTVNREYAGEILVPFSITGGDEWQGLTTTVAAAIKIDLRFRRLLLTHPFKAGIGVGTLATDIAPRTTEMDGECFHRAREALQAAGGRGAPATVLRSGDALFDATVEGYMSLLHVVSSSWSAKQLEVIEAFEAAGTETAASELLGVTQPTVHQSLARSSAKTYAAAAQALLDYAASHHA